MGIYNYLVSIGNLAQSWGLSVSAIVSFIASLGFAFMSFLRFFFPTFLMSPFLVIIETSTSILQFMKFTSYGSTPYL
jgi:hypothetical protein